VRRDLLFARYYQHPLFNPVILSAGAALAPESKDLRFSLPGRLHSSTRRTADPPTARPPAAKERGGEAKARTLRSGWQFVQWMRHALWSECTGRKVDAEVV